MVTFLTVLENDGYLIGFLNWRFLHPISSLTSFCVLNEICSHIYPKER